VRAPMTELTQAWPRPSCPRAIAIIGSGAIVRTAHLPVYRRLGYPVAGVYDKNCAVAKETAAMFDVDRVFHSLEEACALRGVIYDLAVPGDQILAILKQLPEGSGVLMQKPMGRDLDEARLIREIVHERELVAAVNLQLRFSPGMLALRDVIDQGVLGTLVDIDVRIVIDQPWHNWPFLEGAPRLEVPYHSIHYLDAIRSIAGEPEGVYCRVVSHPELPRLRDTRSSIILDYGERIRCSLVLNHTHRAGPRYRESLLLVEGTLGAVRLTWGVNLSYPCGPADTMEVFSDEAWRTVPLRGSWFTEGFEGPMSNLQRVIAGEDPALVSSVDDAIKTMAIVEACYESSEHGAIPIPFELS
jgi:predicted dehydrogenase